MTPTEAHQRCVNRDESGGRQQQHHNTSIETAATPAGSERFPVGGRGRVAILALFTRSGHVEERKHQLGEHKTSLRGFSMSAG